MDKLYERIKELKLPISVRLDVSTNSIPKEILDKEIERRWKTPNAIREAMIVYCKLVIDAIKDRVAAITLPTDKFMMYGSDGIDAMVDITRYAHEAGLLIIEDANLGVCTDEEISNTLEYRLGIPSVSDLKQRVFYNDFMTFNPYSSSSIIENLAEYSKRYEKYGFIAVKPTRSPDDPSDEMVAYHFKNFTTCPIYMKLCHQIEKMDYTGNSGFSNVGISVSFPEYSDSLIRMRQTFPSLFMHLRYYHNLLDSTVPAVKNYGGIVDVISPFNAPNNPTYAGLSIERAIRQNISEIQSFYKSAL